MAPELTSDEVQYFLNTLRATLGLDDLPDRLTKRCAFTLDGERQQDAEAWAVELTISRTTAIFRYQRLGEELAAGRADAYARAMTRGWRKPKPRKRVTWAASSES